MIERTHLSILNSIQRWGTLAAAAKELCVTQSALSQSIKKLEQMSGTSLWAKQGRKIRLTEAGQYLLSIAQRVLPQLEDADQILQKFSEGQRGLLRIGMECHPCYQWLLKITMPYLRAWPQVDVDLRKQYGFNGLRALENHEIDVLVSPDAVHRPDLKFYPVFDYEQVLVVGPDHPWVGLDYVDAVAMQDQVLLSYPILSERLDVYKDFMTPAKIVPKSHIYVEDTEMLLQMVAAGRGVAALPKWLVMESQEHLGLRALSMGSTGVHQKIYLAVRAGVQPQAYMQAFLIAAGAI